MQYQNQRNPVLPLACHVPDGEAHVMPDGALYVYGSWDDGEKYYCSGEYHVAWTRDMKTWHVEDAPSLRAEDVPWAGDPDAPKYPGKTRLYSLKLYQGNADGSDMQLVRDFKPVRLKNGLVVLWDFVNSRAYLPQSTTSPYGYVQFPAVGPDGERIYTGSRIILR